MNHYSIITPTVFTASHYEAVVHLLSQLTTRSVAFTEDDYRRLLASDSSRLLLLCCDDAVVGMLTIGRYYSPTGCKAWIEDVVVDEAYRGKALGRKHPYYKVLSALLHALRAEEPPEDADEWRAEALPEGLCSLTEAVVEEASALIGQSHGVPLPDVFQIIRLCLPFLYAAQRLDGEDYAILWQAHGKERTVCLYCLSPGGEIARITGQQRGAVFFSATLSPLESMKQLLGGDEEDACFALPSPFPPENLRVYVRSLSTRYQHRADTAQQVARLIEEMAGSKAGNYLVFFPSYAYLRLVRLQLNEDALPPFHSFLPCEEGYPPVYWCGHHPDHDGEPH